jgi:hypothetical protein
MLFAAEQVLCSAGCPPYVFTAAAAIQQQHSRNRLAVVVASCLTAAAPYIMEAGTF